MREDSLINKSAIINLGQIIVGIILLLMIIAVILFDKSTGMSTFLTIASIGLAILFLCFSGITKIELSYIPKQLKEKIIGIYIWLIIITILLCGLIIILLISFGVPVNPKLTDILNIFALLITITTDFLSTILTRIFIK